MKYWTPDARTGVFRLDGRGRVCISSIHADVDAARREIQADEEHDPDYCAAHKLCGVLPVMTGPGGALDWSFTDADALLRYDPSWLLS